MGSSSNYPTYSIYLDSPRSEGGLFAALGVTFAVLAFGVWFYDIAVYLQSGRFQILNALSLLQFTGVSEVWVERPTSWLGLHKVLAHTPLSFSMMIVALFGYVIDYHGS